MQERIVLNPPKVDKNRVYYSWAPNRGFKKTGFWVEYPDLEQILAGPGKLAEAYFPVCLGLAAGGPARFVLPARVDEAVLENWRKAIETASQKLYRRPASLSFETTGPEPDYRKGPFTDTALFFGGGTESLLCLARLRAEGESPWLVSLGGTDWAGSDPEGNPDKFRMDEKISSDLNLRLLRVRTNFKEAVNSPNWPPLAKPDVSMVNASLLLPFFLSFMMPVCEQLGIGRLINGNEKMNFPDEYFCFSPAMTSRMTRIARDIVYEPCLSDILKEEVCEELYGKYPVYASYQYSCWRNRGQRWCYRCESCLEYYMLAKQNRLPISTLGMSEAEIRRNLRRLIWEVSSSAEGRAGEIWERICRYKDLRQDPFLRSVLDRIRWGSLGYHVFYKHLPHFLRNRLRLKRFTQA
jgi:hypothetical protein